MKTLHEKEAFLIENGWEKNSRTNRWEKIEWKHEPEFFKLEPHLCPHWYHPGETFEEAYEIAVREDEAKKVKAEISHENAMFLERLLIDAANGSDWNSVRSAVRGFAKMKLLPWYLSECKSTPNPFILKEFNVE